MEPENKKPAVASLTMWASGLLILLEGVPIIYLYGAGGLVLGAVLPNLIAILLAFVIIFGRARASSFIKGIFKSE